MDLESLWFAAVAVLWIGFLLLEGFDFGVAALLPVIGKTRQDKHLMLRSIGPLWDGNEVWLITAAGAVFAAFPGWYSSWLPSLYLPFVLVLFGLIIRAVAFEWRHSHHTEKWDRTWTNVITVGSLIAALAVAEGAVSTDQAFAATHLDELWQAERWGEDALATEVRAARRADFLAAARLLTLLA